MHLHTFTTAKYLAKYNAGKKTTVVFNQRPLRLTLAYFMLTTHFKWSREWIFFAFPCPPTQLRDRPNMVAVLMGLQFCRAPCFASVSVRIYPLHPLSRSASCLANRG